MGESVSGKKLYKRRNYLSKKGPQSRMVAKMMALVFSAIIISVGITSILYFKLSNQQFKGDVPFYYVPEGAAQVVKTPTAFDVLLPGLIVCGVVMGVLTTIIGIFMTHRICGPITNIQKGIKGITVGNLEVVFRIRKDDEFQDLAHDLENMVAAIRIPIINAQKEAAQLAANPDLKRGSALHESLKKLSDNLNYFKAGK